MKETTKGCIRDKLSDEIITGMIEEFKKDELTLEQIAEKFNISISSVSLYKKKYGFTRPYKKSKKTTKKKNNPSTKSIKGVKQKNAEQQSSLQTEATRGGVIFKETRKQVEAGLVKDRHEGMPVDQFIFDEIDQDLMFNYTQLDGKVYEFLLDHIKFDKDDNGDLFGVDDFIVYVTGLSCAQASVIKMCHKLRVNLTFMHYNKECRQYYPQVIWNEFYRNKAYAYFPNYNSITMYNCTFDELIYKKFYSLEIVDFNSKNKTMRNKDLVIAANSKDIWEIFGEKVKEIMDVSGVSRKTIFVNDTYISQGKARRVQINQFSNFK